MLNVSKNNPGLSQDCVDCVNELYGKLFNDLIQFENKTELETYINKKYDDDDKIVDICYKYVTNLISKIKFKNTFEIYQSLYKNKLFEKHLPPKYFFNVDDDDIDFVFDKNDNIHAVLKTKNIFTNEVIDIKSTSDSEFWLVLTENCLNFLNIDGNSLRILGNVILFIISSFHTQKEGEKWMEDHINNEITDKDYFHKFMNYLISIILIDLLDKIPTKNRHSTHELIITIMNNNIIRKFL